MAKNMLEEAITTAAQKFALDIVEAVKSATLQELIELQQAAPKAKRGRKPGKKAAVEALVAEVVKPPRKKRVVTNYPKCGFPGCENNRFPRGKGFCGVHWHQWKKGEIKDVSEYK